MFRALLSGDVGVDETLLAGLTQGLRGGAPGTEAPIGLAVVRMTDRGFKRFPMTVPEKVIDANPQTFIVTR